MGEGIRSAKIVSLLKKPGDRSSWTTLFAKSKPIKRFIRFESSFAGTMGEWKTKVGDTVEIGQELGTILIEGEDGALEDQIEHAAEVLRTSSPMEQANPLNGGNATNANAGTNSAGSSPRSRRQSRAIWTASCRRICRSMRAGMRFARRAKRRRRRMARTRLRLPSWSRGRSCARWKNTRLSASHARGRSDCRER